MTILKAKRCNFNCNDTGGRVLPARSWTHRSRRIVVLLVLAHTMCACWGRCSCTDNGHYKLTDHHTDSTPPSRHIQRTQCYQNQRRTKVSLYSKIYSMRQTGTASKPDGLKDCTYSQQTLSHNRRHYNNHNKELRMHTIYNSLYKTQLQTPYIELNYKLLTQQNFRTSNRGEDVSKVQ